MLRLWYCCLRHQTVLPLPGPASQSGQSWCTDPSGNLSCHAAAAAFCVFRSLAGSMMELRSARCPASGRMMLLLCLSISLTAAVLSGSLSVPGSCSVLICSLAVLCVPGCCPILTGCPAAVLRSRLPCAAVLAASLWSGLPCATVLADFISILPEAIH